MIFLLGLLGICVFLSTKQERFIGNLKLSDESETFTFIPNTALNHAYLLSIGLVFCARCCATPSIQSWFVFACAMLALAQLRVWHAFPLWQNPFAILRYLALLSHGLVFLWWAWNLQYLPFSHPLAEPFLFILTGYWLVVTVIWWYVRFKAKHVV